MSADDITKCLIGTIASLLVGLLFFHSTIGCLVGIALSWLIQWQLARMRKGKQ